MGNIVVHDQPCLDTVDCNSSDARQIYEDGSSFCFSCKKSFKKETHENVQAPKAPKMKSKNSSDAFEKVQSVEEIFNYPTKGLIDRRITKHITEFFDVRVSVNSNGEIDTHYYPYVDDDNLSYKIRKLPKKFSSAGDFRGLFGKVKFNSGGKRLVITEGEIDAMSVAQAYYDYNKIIYPVVSMGSAANIKNLLANRDWIRSFEEVVLCFDEDDAGRELLAKAIDIVGLDKARITKLPFKDANDVYNDGEEGRTTLLKCIWNAESHRPAGIMTKSDLKASMRALQKEPSVPYPDCLAGVQTKLKGMRLRQIALYISGTGSGKSTLIREVILHLLKITDDKIGIISLEETPGETARSMSSMALSRNLANEEISEEDLDTGFDMVFDSDRVIVLDHQGSINDKSIVDQMEYMALMGCKYLFIDHITILVSEGAAELKGNEAIDKIMNDLLRVVKKHEIHIGLVSHLRKTETGGKSFEEGKLPSLDDIKGSGSIKQVSMDIIGFARNMRSEDASVRNHILIEVLKCRSTGLSGPVEGANYNFITGRMTRAGNINTAEDFKVTKTETVITANDISNSIKEVKPAIPKIIDENSY